MHGMGIAVNDKKMQVLRELIQMMFKEEAMGNGDEPIDVEQALHEASESPEEEALEHAGGISEEEENAMEGPDEDLKETMAKFMKQSRKTPVKGRTKAVVLAAESGNSPSAPKKSYGFNKGMK